MLRAFIEISGIHNGEGIDFHTFEYPRFAIQPQFD